MAGTAELSRHGQIEELQAEIKALSKSRNAVILAHNHPSGVAEPSRADEALTQALKQSLALVDVRVLDHFVIGGAAAMSFAERGLL